MIVLGRNANYDSHDYTHAHVRDVRLSGAARSQGTYVIGTTGTGKTTFLLNLIFQDMLAGDGVCVLDPHGDFTLDILDLVPASRRDDVIVLDPADIEHPFGLNLFDCNRDDPRERDLVTSTIIDTLHKLFKDSWGPRMEDLLRHGILSLLLHDEPTTLIHLMMIMVSYEHRQRLTKRAREVDPILRFYWEDEFPESKENNRGERVKNRQQIELVQSSLNKIGRFITNPIIRNIVGQPQSSVNLRQVMDEGKILLVNLSKGDIGQDNSSLLGAVLVNQLLIAALSRREIPEGQRRPFHLYVDEYQNFATKTFPQLQSEARKYAIDTVVAHQFRDQLDDENQGSTLNVANIVCFRVSGKDAIEIAQQYDLTPPDGDERFEPIVYEVDEGVFAQEKTGGTGTGLFRVVEAEQRTYSDSHLQWANILSQLKNHQAICRVLEASDRPRELEQYRLNPFDKPRIERSWRDYIIERNRSERQFSRDEIERYIADYTSSDGGDSDIGISDYR